MDAALLDELRRRYAEPHRAWHVWARVGEMLGAVEEIAAAIGDRPAFILAVLFHRAVFDRRSADGAERSVTLMRRMLSGATADATLARAEALIRAVNRQEMPRTEDASLRGDAALLLDMDAAALGAPEAGFAEYEAAYRREFAHLSDDGYAAGRAASLRALMWRERIYLTDRYALPFERRARRNVERLVATLGA